MRHPRFTLRALQVAMLVAACFYGGIRFERERQRRQVEAARIAAEKATFAQAQALSARLFADFAQMQRDLADSQERTDELLRRLQRDDFKRLLQNRPPH